MSRFVKLTALFVIVVGFSGAVLNWLDASVGHYPVGAGPWPEIGDGFAQLVLGLIGLVIWRRRELVARELCSMLAALKA